MPAVSLFMATSELTLIVYVFHKNVCMCVHVVCVCVYCFVCSAQYLCVSYRIIDVILCVLLCVYFVYLAMRAVVLKGYTQYTHEYLRYPNVLWATRLQPKYRVLGCTHASLYHKSLSIEFHIGKTIKLK